MDLFFSLWYQTLQSWFGDWTSNVNDWVYGDGSLLSVLENVSSYSLPDFLYIVGCILIVVLSLVALFALFKWMFTLVWRLFKID